MLSLLIGLGSANTVPAADLFEKEAEKEAEAVKLVRDALRGGYDVITAGELHQRLAAEKALLVIDTMPLEESFKKEHVPGAKQFLFPIPDMGAWDKTLTDGKSQEDFLALLGPDKDRPVVFYCGFVKCTRSHNGAAWASKLGYRKVSRFPGGIYAWKGAKYEIESTK